MNDRSTSRPRILTPEDRSSIQGDVLTLTGTSSPESTIELLDWLTAVAVTTSDMDGNWSVTVASVETGNHMYSACMVGPRGARSPHSNSITVTMLAVDSAVVRPNAPQVGRSSTTDLVASRLRRFRLSLRENRNTKPPIDEEAKGISGTAPRESWGSSPAKVQSHAADGPPVTEPPAQAEAPASHLDAFPGYIAGEVVLQPAPQERELLPERPSIEPVPPMSAGFEIAGEPSADKEPSSPSSDSVVEPPVPLDTIDLQAGQSPSVNADESVIESATEVPGDTIATEESTPAIGIELAPPSSTDTTEDTSGFGLLEAPLRPPTVLVATPVAPVTEPEEILVRESSEPAFALVYSTRTIPRREAALQTLTCNASRGNVPPTPDIVAVDSVLGGPISVSVEHLETKYELTSIRAYSVLLPADLE